MFSVSQKEKIFFAEHLALMIKGGLTITESLETLREQTRSRKFKKTLESVLKRVLKGESLAQSFSRHPSVFNKFFCSIVGVGEESGTLEENLNYLTLQLRKDYDLKRKVKSAMIYPILVVCLALGIAFFVTLFVLPKVIDLFKNLDMDVPLTTKILISFTYFFKENWPFVIVGFFLFVVLINVLLKIKSIRFFFHKIIISLPIFGNIIKDINLARFSRTFYTLLKSGMPLIEALETCNRTLPNDVYKRNLNLAKQRIEKGEKISESLGAFPQTFSPIFTRMILVGEKSGTLEESFLYLATFHEEEVDTSLKNLSGLLEPILLIFVGLLVGFIAFSVIIPIYRFVGGLRFN